MDIHSSAHCFAFLDKKERDFLENKKNRLEYSKNELIYKQNALNPNVFFILSGYVKLYIETGKNKRLTIHIASAGEFLALSSLFAHDKYQCSASALTDTTVCLLDKNGLRDLMNRNHEFLLFLTRKSFELEHRLIDVIKNVSYKQMRGKLASALVYLDKISVGENITQLMTRQEIADFSGITLESAVSFIKEFSNEGIIELDGRAILIKDKKKLELISEIG